MAEFPGILYIEIIESENEFVRVRELHIYRTRTTALDILKCHLSNTLFALLNKLENVVN